MMIGTVMMAMEADDGDKVEDDGDAWSCVKLVTVMLMAMKETDD